MNPRTVRNGAILAILFWSCVCIILTQCSCSVQAAIPQRIGGLSDKDEVYHPETAEMVVTAERLYVRTQPDGEISTYLILGDVVTVYAVKMIGDTNWCRITPEEHSPRWVGCGWLEAK